MTFISAALFFLQYFLIFLKNVFSSPGKFERPYPFTNMEDLFFDENRHLSENYLLYPDDENCHVIMANLKSLITKEDIRYVETVTGDLEELLFSSVPGSVKCPVICIDKGVSESLLQYVLPNKNFFRSEETGYFDSLVEWFYQECQAIEVGFINWGQSNLKIRLAEPNEGPPSDFATLSFGEERWFSASVGSKFELLEIESNSIQLDFIAEFNVFKVIGHPRPYKIYSRNITADVQELLNGEWFRSRMVTRTFTQLGFDKGHLPNDLWGSISTFYYNNRENYVLEEWDESELYVNWWESNVYVIGMPSELRTYWHSRLKLLVEEWVGVELELTDIYGMRRYENGARLLTHVDRETTHATSL